MRAELHPDTNKYRAAQHGAESESAPFLGGHTVEPADTAVPSVVMMRLLLLCSVPRR